MKVFLKVFVWVLAILYPVAVFYGVQYFQPKYMALLLAIVLLYRFATSQNGKGLIDRKTAIVGALLGLLIVLYSWFYNSVGGLKLYPVLINMTLLVVFFTSLYYPPSIIERLARLRQPDLPQSGIDYTRRVTKIWILFFIVNGTIALYTAIFASMEVWVLYNGLVAYIAMGCLFAGEFVYRKLVIGKGTSQ